MASADERKELLAAVHEHLLQNGYQKAARELLLQSGQKTFPPFPVPLKDIFAQWKKTSSQNQKPGTPVKVRVSDPQSSSESSEEEETAAAKPIKANLPVNNSSIAKAESSSEDEDSSSEEEAAPSKMVNTLTENKASGCLQLAAQKSNSFPGKGVAVAAVQAKGQQNKAVSNKQPTPAATKAGQNRNLFGKSALQSPVGAGQNTAQAKKKGADSESSGSSGSSSSSESEEDKTKPVVKSPILTPAKKAESSSEDSSDSSEEETKVAAPQTKAVAPSAQTNLAPAKGISDTAVLLKSNAGKALSAKKAGSQTTAQSGLMARSTKPADSSESSSSSDSEAEEPPSVTQTKLPGKSTSAFSSAKSTPLSLPSNKSASVQSPLKPALKPSVSNFSRLIPAKSVGTTKKAGSSESSESSSESEDDPSSIPVSQKRLQAVHASSEAKESQTNKAGSPAKAASGALKGKKTESESSSTSDSEDETISVPHNLPPPTATKGNVAAQAGSAMKAQGPPGSLQKTQDSEDSSQDSSDDSESEEETVFTQKPPQLTQKPASIPAKTPVAKKVAATTKKAGSTPPTGKGATKPVRSLQNISDSGTSDSSEDKGAAGKSVKQPPIHHFFQQKTGKATITSKKGIQANSNPPNSISSSCQSPSTGTMEKVEQSPSKKAKLSQEPRPPPPPAVTPKPQESSGSSSSSDSEEEPYMGIGAIQIPQLASTNISQKPGLVKKTESSSEESSGEDQEPSQSLLTGGSSQFKIPTSILAKNASVIRTSKSSGKASTSSVTPVLSNLVKSSGQTAASSSSSGSSDSDTDIEEMVGQQKDTGTLLPSEKETGGAKGAVAGKPGLLSSGPKASLEKKASTKTQSNGKTKETPLALPSKEQVLPQVPGAGGDTAVTTLFAAVKNPKTQKSSKKRKLGAEDGGLGEPKGKKLKEQHGPDMPKKLKKKKKDKTSGKTLKKKEGKAKKSDKKKKEKKLESSAADGSQKKKKKKKKKAGDLGGAA